MNFPLITRIIVGVSVVGLLTWTCVMMFVAPEATVSVLVRDTTREHPIVPFAMGVLVGHWWFLVRGKPKDVGK